MSSPSQYPWVSKGNHYSGFCHHRFASSWIEFFYSTCMFLKFIPVVVWITIVHYFSLLYSILLKWICHNFLIHSPANGHLGFSVLVAMTKTSVKNSITYLFGGHLFSFILGISGVKFLNHSVGGCSSLRNYSLQSGFIILHSYQWYSRVLIVPHSC